MRIRAYRVQHYHPAALQGVQSLFGLFHPGVDLDHQSGPVFLLTVDQQEDGFFFAPIEEHRLGDQQMIRQAPVPGQIHRIDFRLPLHGPGTGGRDMGCAPEGVLDILVGHGDFGALHIDAVALRGGDPGRLQGPDDHVVLFHPVRERPVNKGREIA